MSVLSLLGEVLCLYCLSFYFDFEQSQTTEKKPGLAVNWLSNNPARVIIDPLRIQEELASL